MEGEAGLKRRWVEKVGEGENECFFEVHSSVGLQSHRYPGKSFVSVP